VLAVLLEGSALLADPLGGKEQRKQGQQRDAVTVSSESHRISPFHRMSDER
jgi:hypothetical protein